MILHKKGPRKAQFGLSLAAGAAKAGLQAFTNWATAPGVDTSMTGMADTGLAANNYNTTMQQGLNQLYEDNMATNIQGRKKKRLQRAWDANFRQGDWETDEYGNMAIGEGVQDSLGAVYDNMSRRTLRKEAKARGLDYKHMSKGDLAKSLKGDELGNWDERYFKQHRTSANQAAKNQDMMASQGLVSSAMKPFSAEKGAKILIKKACKGAKTKNCGGKLQRGGKTPNSLSKVTVDSEGPVKSIKKKTISGAGPGNKLHKGKKHNIMRRRVSKVEKEVDQLERGQSKIKKKLGKFGAPGKPGKTLKRKDGGVLEKPGAVNVVVKGKLHKENNNLGNKDKGVPVVSPDGEKTYEVEKQEVIFRKPLTKAIEKARDKYKGEKDDALLEEVGQLVANELLNNTQDNDGKFGVKVAEAAV
jgi:hypothetical protein